MKPGFLYNLDKLFGLALQLLPDDGAVKKAFMNIIFGPCRILIGPFSLFLGKPDKNLSDELGKLFLIAEKKEKKAKLCRLHLHSLIRPPSAEKLDLTYTFMFQYHRKILKLWDKYCPWSRRDQKTIGGSCPKSQSFYGGNNGNLVQVTHNPDTNLTTTNVASPNHNLSTDSSKVSQESRIKMQFEEEQHL